MANALPRAVFRQKWRLLQKLSDKQFVILPLAAFFAGSLAATGFQHPKHCLFESLCDGPVLRLLPTGKKESVFEKRVVLTVDFLDRFLLVVFCGVQNLISGSFQISELVEGNISLPHRYIHMEMVDPNEHDRVERAHLRALICMFFLSGGAHVLTFLRNKRILPWLISH